MPPTTALQAFEKIALFQVAATMAVATMLEMPPAAAMDPAALAALMAQWEESWYQHFEKLALGDESVYPTPPLLAIQAAAQAATPAFLASALGALDGPGMQAVLALIPGGQAVAFAAKLLPLLQAIGGAVPAAPAAPSASIPLSSGS